MNIKDFKNYPLDSFNRAKELFFNGFPFLFMQLEYKDSLYLYNSDFHLFHKNIMYYNKKERELLLENELKEVLEECNSLRRDETKKELIFETEQKLTHYLTEVLINLLSIQLEYFTKQYRKENPNKKINYINLGDLIFNFSAKKEEEIKGSKGFQLFEELFLRKDLFDKKILIYGNHDSRPYKYKPYFDKILPYYVLEQNDTYYLFTHVPIANFVFEDNTTVFSAHLKDFLNFCLDNGKVVNKTSVKKMIEKCDTLPKKNKDENKLDTHKDFHKSFHELDIMVLKKVFLMDKNIINIHWHIHSYPHNKEKLMELMETKLGIKMKDILYKNVCIDNVINQYLKSI